MNKKEPESANNKTKMIDLEYQNKLLKAKLDDLKNKEINELKNIKKSYEDSSTPTKIPQIIRKKDDKKDSLPKIMKNQIGLKI